MVKFSKQLEGQLVPEWRPAYVNYKILKKELKKLKQQQPTRSYTDGLSHSFRAALNSSFSSDRRTSLTSASSSAAVCPAPQTSSRVSMTIRREPSETLALAESTSSANLYTRFNRRRSTPEEIIQVRKVGDSPWEIYETLVLEPLSYSDPAKTFFARLDTQFNKVNEFYASKEKEFVEQGQILEKQMQGLVDLRKVYKEQLEHLLITNYGDSKNFEGLVELAGPGAGSFSQANFDVEAGNSMVETKSTSGYDSLHSCTKTLQTGRPDDEAMVTEEAGVDPDDEALVAKDGGVDPSNDSETGSSSRQHTIHQMFRRILVPFTTPSTALSGTLHSLWDDAMKQGCKSNSHLQNETFNQASKKKLQVAEKMLRSALIEYYRGLNLLKSYSSLNLVAFAKILKKFDKVSGYRTSSIYLKAVEASYFNISDKVLALIERVEGLFTEHFAKSNRRKAMLSLRPTYKKASHTVTFILGVFVGGSLALLAVFGVLARTSLPKYPHVGDSKEDEEIPPRVYTKAIFPVFSMVMLLLVHLYMYGVDLYFWRRLRVNYAFIFEFAPGTELRHRQVLMVSSVLMTLTMGCMVSHLALRSVNTSPYVDLIPFGLVMLMVGVLVFPLNILYRSSRFFFLKSMLHIIGSPFYKVVLADFFLADQLTSQVPMFRNMQYVMCYYFSGFFKKGRPTTCLSNTHYKGLTYLISLLPYWWRFMQCGRRFADEADKAHLANGGKYLSALVAVAFRIQYSRNNAVAWAVLFVLSSVVATVYQVYWDLVVDWGLLRKNSSNKWLRDLLIMPRRKYVYFSSMVLNVILRLAWLQSVTRFRFGTLDPEVTDFIFASLEVVRRGHWNFYRLENEHLNNVGKYRATKTVPLPFEDALADDY